MCHSKPNSGAQAATAVAQIDGRPVLQPAGNRVTFSILVPSPTKSLTKSVSLPPSFTDSNRKASRRPPSHSGPAQVLPAMSAAMIFPPEPVEPGSIAAAQREHAALVHARRKSRIAHYGRAASFSRIDGTKPSSPPSPTAGAGVAVDEKRCSFITPYSDPIYVSYHDEEWGVPVHDEERLFELLTMSAVQVGSDWASILRRRGDLRRAFAGFDVDTVAKYTEKQMAAVSADCRLDVATVRGVVDNANHIIEVRSKFGSFDKYIWGFVNRKPLAPCYKYARKIPVKTSKSESISKDLVRRGFRLVGPTVLHSFMQAAGLTNDHLTSCPRHRFCSVTASSS